MGFVYTTEKELEEACRYWQKVLRLQDWRVSTGIFRSFDIIENAQGQCSWKLARKEARIKLLDPIDYEENVEYPQDHEVTLVHELLHLHFAMFMNDEQETELEQAIVVISQALVNCKRG